MQGKFWKEEAAFQVPDVAEIVVSLPLPSVSESIRFFFARHL
jgi:hypothetical protein